MWHHLYCVVTSFLFLTDKDPCKCRNIAFLYVLLFNLSLYQETCSLFRREFPFLFLFLVWHCDTPSKTTLMWKRWLESGMALMFLQWWKYVQSVGKRWKYVCTLWTWWVSYSLEQSPTRNRAHPKLHDMGGEKNYLCPHILYWFVHSSPTSIFRLEGGALFQQDNARSYTAAARKRALRDVQVP